MSLSKTEELVKEYNKMEGRIQAQLPKGYKLRLDLNHGQDYGHHIRVRGRSMDLIVPCSSMHISRIFIKAIRWSWKQVGERRVRNIYIMDKNGSCGN